MPASETQDGRRGGGAHTAIFWTGFGLAPLAALLVLTSSGTAPLRIAVLLAILAVVLIGVSVMLRPDARRVRAELEESLIDEMGGLRADVRQDITSAARATHKSLSEKLQNLYEHVEALRGQVDATRGQLEAMRGALSPGVPTAAAAVPQAGQATPAATPSRSVGTAMVGGGLVRHTETVQVTTRQTIVDPRGDDDRGRVYGTSAVYGHRADELVDAPVGRRRADRDERSGHDERSWRGGWEAPREESWTEQHLRDRLRDSGSLLPAGHGARADTGHRDTGHGDHGGGSHASREEYGQEYRRRAGSHSRDDADTSDVADDPHWSDLRAGDRWASVRSDERGRELRMGERRAALHSDEGGTELRIEDRWAAVRREESARGEGRRPEHAETRRERREREELWSAGGDAEERWSGIESGRGRHGWPPALPASDEYAPSWSRRWREEPQGGHREREDRWGGEELPHPVSPRPRRLDFELTDERWG
jgi:hypothetical protein